MKKSTLLEIILGTIGGLTFSLGMCMCLLPEWNMFAAGVVIGIIGAVILLCIIPVYLKDHPRKKNDKKVDWSLLLTWIVGVVGSLILGFGMSKILVDGASSADMLVGLITGIIGLIICILNYPIHAYIKNPRD